MLSSNRDMDPQSTIRYEADESPPRLVTLGLALQMAILCVGGIVLTPVIVIRAAAESQEFMFWAVFAAVVISGINTILQAVRVGRIGAGYVLLMGTSGAFIAISIYALQSGGPAMLGTLVIISALFQFLISARLSLLRRVLTQTVSGTVIMLIPVAIMPILFDMLQDVPGGTQRLAGPITALVTVVTILGLALKAHGQLRMWAPVIGVVVGSVTGAFFGLYDTSVIDDSAWLGIPNLSGYPGLDLSFSTSFWALLPAFVFVTLVGAVETIGDSIAIQRVSWKKPRAIDFRSVQGAVAADGLGNLMAGFGGTIPNTTYSSAVSITELTGVASRSVGVAIGGIFLVLAFFPKFLATIVAVPGPVAGGFLIILLAMLFVVGMRIVIQDGITYRKGLIAGIAFWIGTGFEANAIYPEMAAEFAGGILTNGMTSGGLVAILMTLFMNGFGARPSKTEAALEVESLPSLQKFIRKFAVKSKWSYSMSFRLEAVVEEMVLTLAGKDDDEGMSRHLLLEARKDADKAILEFTATTDEGNLQDQITLLSDQATEAAIEQEISLRLIKHLSTSVRHQSYHNTDIVTVVVQSPAAQPEAAESKS